MTALTKPFISLADACRLLLDENVVAVPTETVYGLAALATSEKAINKIYQIKNRPSDNPLICHFENFQKAVAYLKPYPAYVDVLHSAFSPGPLSYLLPLKENSGLKYAVRNQTNVIVRVPSHPLFLELLRCVGNPLAAPSANTSGKFSSTSAQMVANDLGDKLDGILDGGISESGIESTIIDCTDEKKISILRPGAIGRNDISYVLQNHGINIPVDYSKAIKPTPGSTYKHYAPSTPITRIIKLSDVPDDGKNSCALFAEELFSEAKTAYKLYASSPRLISLGSQNEPQQIAQHLYALMARLDELKVDHAYILYPLITDPDWHRAIIYRLDKITELR